MKDNRKIARLSDLRNASNPVKWVTLITLYRTVAFPFLLVLIFTNRFDVFKWLLIVSFMTDAFDGFLARKFKANSVLGAKLDSIGDDLTILAAITGLAVAKTEFLKTEWLIFAIPLSLFFIQLAVALIKYRKMSSFHAYLAKTAAIMIVFALCEWKTNVRGMYWY
jgi:phosphatidylglycerophosphate synthase